MNIRHRIVALIIKNNKLLLVKGKGYSELWTPGGKREEGESEEETLKRELKEEINLDLQSMVFFREYFMQSPYSNNWMTETKCFLVEAKGEPKADKEIESIVWYGKDDFLTKKYPMIEENEKGLIPDLIKEGLIN
ncbi:NUDIX domain-containing protein [Candidatus Pacearchaeota archaeon]|nr:NUDIX domain-containing protein [Candidatus Pacearchaeota archaeon]